ncbi:MAG: ABC-2 transporter permease [[Clostridium] scindens]
MMNMIMEQPIFLLPISRQSYTMEKYVFGLITTMLAWVVFTAAALATYYRQISRSQTVAGHCRDLSGSTLLLLAITIPIQLVRRERSWIA